MTTIKEIKDNLLKLLDKFYLRKQSDDYNVSGVLVTDANKNITTQQSLSANSTLISGLSNVATSGSYSDLSNKPTKLTDFNNDLTTHSTQRIPVDDDLDTYTTVGWYYCYSTDDAKTLSHTVWQETPSEDTSLRVGLPFALEVTRASDNGRRQTLYVYWKENTDEVNTYSRNKGVSSSWTAWVKTYNTSNLTKEVITNLGISSSDHTHNTSNITDSNTYNVIGNSSTNQESINQGIDKKLRVIGNDLENITGSLLYDTDSMNDASLIKQIYTAGTLSSVTLTYSDGVFNYVRSGGDSGYQYHKIPLSSIPTNFEISFKGKVSSSGSRDLGVVLSDPTNDSYELFYARAVSSSKVMRYTHASSTAYNNSSVSHSITSEIATATNTYYNIRFLKVGDAIILRIFTLEGQLIDSLKTTLTGVNIEEVGLVLGWDKSFNITVKDIEVFNYDNSEYLRRDDIIDKLNSTDTDKPLSANQGKTLSETKLNNNYDNDITGTVNKLLVTDSSDNIKTSETINASLVEYGQNNTNLDTIINELFDSSETYTLPITVSNSVLQVKYAHFTKIGRFCIVEFGFESNSLLPASGNSIYGSNNYIELSAIDSKYVPSSTKYYDFPSINKNIKLSNNTYSEDYCNVRLKIENGVFYLRPIPSKKVSSYGSFVYTI